MEADPFVAAAGIPGEDAVADGSLDAAQWAELVSGLLTFSPDNRLTARQVQSSLVGRPLILSRSFICVAFQRGNSV